MLSLWWYYWDVALAFLIWGGLWFWLISRRKARFSVRTLFVIITGYAVMAGIAADFISRYR